MQLEVGAQIINCHNINTTVKASGSTSIVGGIVGTNWADISIKDCTNSGIVIGTYALGGIIGSMGMLDEDNIIENCSNTGKIIGENRIGGIVGLMNTVGTVTNSYNSGEITGENRVGGIVGRAVANSNITNCYNKGAVEGSTNIGAVIGEQQGDTTNLNNLYYLNTLNVKAVNNQDYEEQSIMGISQNFNSLAEFLNWLKSSVQNP